MDGTQPTIRPGAASAPAPSANAPMVSGIHGVFGTRPKGRALIADVVGNCLVLADGRGGAFGRPLRADERLYTQVLRESGVILARKSAEEARTFPLARFLGQELRPGMTFEWKA